MKALEILSQKSSNDSLSAAPVKDLLKKHGRGPDKKKRRPKTNGKYARNPYFDKLTRDVQTKGYGR